MYSYGCWPPELLQGLRTQSGLGYIRACYGVVAYGRVWMCGYGPGTSSCTPATECQGRGGESRVFPTAQVPNYVAWIIQTIWEQASAKHSSKSRRLAGTLVPPPARRAVLRRSLVRGRALLAPLVAAVAAVQRPVDSRPRRLQAEMRAVLPQVTHTGEQDTWHSCLNRTTKSQFTILFYFFVEQSITFG